MEELASTVNDLHRAKQAAVKANRAKSQFLNSISHELRTPLHGLTGMSEVLESTGLSEEQHTLVDVMKSSAAHLLTVVNDVLDFSKLDSRMMTLKISECRIRKAFDRVASMTRIANHRKLDKKVQLACHVNRNVPTTVALDETRVCQILINFLGNSFKFTKRGSVTMSLESMPMHSSGELLATFKTMLKVRSRSARIPYFVAVWPKSRRRQRREAAKKARAESESESHQSAMRKSESGRFATLVTIRPSMSDMRLHDAGSSNGPKHLRVAAADDAVSTEYWQDESQGHKYTALHFEVKDTGSGIKREHLPLLFRAFRQVGSKQHSSAIQGTGLGLAICRHLVQMMSGALWVESDFAVGSSFHVLIRVPVVANADGKDNRNSPSSTTPFSLTPAGGVEHKDVDESKHTSDNSESGDDLNESDSSSLLPGIPMRASVPSRVAVIPERESAGELSHRQQQQQQMAVRAQAQSLALTLQPTDGDMPTVDASDFAKLKLLIVDDDRVNRLISKRFLRDVKCLLDVAADGEEGLIKATSTRYDIIFMDLHMPKLDGRGALRKITTFHEQFQRWPCPVLIAMTADVMLPDDVKDLVNDLLRKPFTKRDMFGVIGKWTQVLKHHNRFAADNSTDNNE
eukprot:TRINITY_DN68071_c0_g1_i11.p1 TRINITY_DN68071_c0_g1~~TRINITY_DN68071_c0_g1_i11.p1  ORF type:complete len:629 (-),score=358.31 TRINITY_DN68071_c0_g1_i11:813-2699(-)